MFSVFYGVLNYFLSILFIIVICFLESCLERLGGVGSGGYVNKLSIIPDVCFI